MSQTLDEQVKNYLHQDRLVLPGAATKLTMCQFCGSLVPNTDLFTGKAQDVICPACLKKNEGLAFVMCRKCNKVHGMYKPGIVKLQNGVVVRIDPGDTLHTAWCQYCNPNQGGWDIEEFKTLVMQSLGNAPKEAPDGLEAKD